MNIMVPSRNIANVMTLFLVVALLIVSLAPLECRGATNRVSEKKAIVLAMFGTSHVDALPAILTIRDRMQGAFPKIPVRIAFTSNIIKRIWRHRHQDPEYRKNNPLVPEEILAIKGLLATIADLQDQDYGYILVQPILMSSGEEYTDMTALVRSLNSMETVKERNMPFQGIFLGRPVMGTHGIVHQYQEDLAALAGILKGDIATASAEKRALVYMAHGNEHFSSGYVMEFEELMNSRYPETRTYVTQVEGFPGFKVLARRLAADGVTRVLLKPFMTVAGDHAKNDMAGEEPDSLKRMLEEQGLDVAELLTGLGEMASFADLFVDHLRDTAREHGIDLEKP